VQRGLNVPSGPDFSDLAVQEEFIRRARGVLA
jgi:hypothetical protein